MTLLVTSATGANGAGYGKILAFADDGKPIGVFGDDPLIADPRGLGIDQVDKLLSSTAARTVFSHSTVTEWSCGRAERWRA